MSKKYVGLVVVIIVVLMFTLAACKKKENAASQSEEESSFVYSTKGPDGSDPVSYKEVQLTKKQQRAAQDKKYKIAVLMHTSSDFANSVIAGVENVAKSVDAEIVLVTDAEFDANKQTSDIENALVLTPDVIITLILDPVAGAAALQPAIDKGVKIVLLSNLPKDFVHGRDYASIVTDDLFSMGESIAQLIGSQLGESGEVGLIFHDANYYVTNQRDNAVKSVLMRDFPNINIVVERGIANPSDGEVIASAMLTQFPTLNAIYAPWDSIAEGVIAATRSANRDDVGVFTMDLGATTVLDLAKGGNMAGIVADLPYDLGQTLAYAGILSALGEETPKFVTVPAIKVTRGNIEKAWKQSLHRELPVEIKQVLEK